MNFKQLFFTVTLSGILSAASAGSILSSKQKVSRLLAKPYSVAYDRVLPDGSRHLQIRNISDGGFLLLKGQQVLGYSTDGAFDEATAAPAMLDMLQAMQQQGLSDETVMESSAVEPLLGNIAWNQDSPYNDLCPLYEMNSRCPTGCVATAMAQVMYYNRWPLKGTGSHSYQPAIMSGNTLSADFGNTTYQWDAMLPNYKQATVPADGYTMDECRQAVSVLMLHCGVAVDMVYYSQSGATDYDVPPALVSYFGYDRSLAYRKREHYSTIDWLQILHDEFAAGRPVLAYGRATSGGHAYVFDGMDEQGFIHVNWGWGGMSNGYFRTSALTPASQGIGGSDGGFNYSQRIITGIRPDTGENNDYDVELTSTEGLNTSKQKIASDGTVTIRLTGKVKNHGWRDAAFDYALLLLSDEGDTACIIRGPENQTLAMNATDYAPTFGTVSFGALKSGNYRLYPACRMTGGRGPWLRIRDNYIGYVNRLDVTVTESNITFNQPNYFQLKATDIEAPATIYSGMPTLITTNVENQGDVEYHGEVKAQLRKGSSIVSTTSNYIIDLQPGENTQIRFTDSFTADAGDYTLCLIDDDGTIISSKLSVIVKPAPASATVVATEALKVDKALPLQMQTTATVDAGDGIFGGLLYTFILSADGKTELGCLFPEYVMLDSDHRQQTVVMKGTMENGVPGTTYCAQLAVYDGSKYTFLNDDNAITTFVFDPEHAANGISSLTIGNSKSKSGYNLLGQPVSNARQHTIIVNNGRKTVINKK